MYLWNSHIWGLRPHYVRPLGMGRFRSFMFGRTNTSHLEGHMAACSEGHFLSIVFGRTHRIMFGSTLFRI